MSKEKKKVVIVGAGPGGLTAGMILSSKGFDVEIYEKEDKVGGRNAEIKVGEYSFDIGPTFLMMKNVLDDMFEMSGEKSSDYLDFKRLDPMYSLFFDDLRMDISQDRKKLQAQIDKHFPGNEEGLEKFLKHEAKRFEVLFPILKKDYSTFRSFFNPIFIKALPHIPFGKSIFDELGKYFNEDKLRLAFTFQAKYLGMSPWECPGLFTILPYLEHEFGIYHVQGGLNKISEAMAKVIKKNGGKIYLNSPVKKILVDKKFLNKKAKGVELENGKKVLGDYTIINADFTWAANNLFDEGVLTTNSPEKINKKEYSCSTYMAYIALDKKYDDLPHHSIVFSSKYEENIEDIFKRKIVTREDFSFYVRNDVVTDSSTAPNGKSGLYCLIPVPNNKSDIDWKEDKEELYKNLISEMKDRLGLKDIEEHIVDHKIINPEDWFKDFNVNFGAVFGMSHVFSQLLNRRPHNRLNEVRNCYLVGGNTHPGSGLPTIYESGRIASDAIVSGK